MRRARGGCDEPAAGLDTKERAELGALTQWVAAEWNIGILLIPPVATRGSIPKNGLRDGLLRILPIYL
jgi:hypothetical protein